MNDKIVNYLIEMQQVRIYSRCLVNFAFLRAEECLNELINFRNFVLNDNGIKLSRNTPNFYFFSTLNFAKNHIKLSNSYDIKNY